MSCVDDARPEPGRPAFRLIPKPGGGVRRLTVLHPIDEDAYRRAVARLGRMVERVLAPAVLANRLRGSGQLELRPWRAERAIFEHRRLALVASSPVVVKTDVASCYPAVGPAAVERAMVRLGAWRRDVTPVRATLEAFHDVGVVGLPIGPEPSAVLANGVLAAADRSVAAAGARHLRWVDDLWAGARDERHADEILDRLRTSLARAGLSLNQAKTRVLDRVEAGALLGGPVAEDRYR